MDRREAARIRYQNLRRTLADEKKVRARSRRFRLLGLGVVGAWILVPAALWDVDLDSAAGPEFFRTPTAHEEYLLEIASLQPAANSMERAWEAVSLRAIDAPVLVGHAYHEIGTFPGDDPQAVGLRVRVPEGQRLRLSVRGQGDAHGRLFIDLFRAAQGEIGRRAADGEPGLESAHGGPGPGVAEGLPGSEVAAGLPGPRPAYLESGELTDDGWTFDAAETGEYVLRVQPELGGLSRYDLTLQIGARWRFPVAGGGEGDIGGVFGDPRDGGARDHHGVDIFKPRGTAVLAASDGVVRAADTTEIGGRVVWQREQRGSHSIYYAHLDQILVEEGQRLRAGDTVGLVGNTGNARSTPPHLHFGAYNRGPVDPWNLILPVPPQPPPIQVLLDHLGREAQLEDGTSVRLLAGAGGRFRVAFSDGRWGFVDPGSVRVIPPPGT